MAPRDRQSTRQEGERERPREERATRHGAPTPAAGEDEGASVQYGEDPGTVEREDPAE